MGKYRRRVPHKKGRGQCVFCSKGGLSKQHMWPDWIKKIVPRTDSSHTQHLMRFNILPGKTALIRPELQQHRGNIGARKIRNVCKSCNSGWMSRVEERAKPILTKLILGESTEINKLGQKEISSWATLMAVIAEYTDLETLAISETDRQWLMKNSEPPDGWRIWLGTYSGDEWKMRYRHHGAAAVRLPIFNRKNIRCNTQSTTIVVGKMLMHMQSSSFNEVELGFQAGTAYNLIPIWPPSISTVMWPIETIINDREAKEISDDLYNSLLRRLN